MTDNTRDKRQIFLIIILVLSSILITSLALEITLRIIGYNPLESILGSKAEVLRSSTVSERAYEAVPNVEVTAWGTHIKINSYGFRDKEYDLAKSDGTYRIIVLGDSITFGIGMPFSAVYTEQLEDLFASKRKKVEVLNLSLQGYNTLSEVSTLEQIGLQFQPDMVIVGYCVNDIEPTSNLASVIKIEKYRSFIYKARLIQFVSAKINKLKGILQLGKMNQASQFIENNKEYMTDISGDQELNTLINSLQTQIEKTGDSRWLSKTYSSRPHLSKLRYSFERLKRSKDKYGFDVTVMLISFFNENESTEGINKIVYNIVEHESNRLGFNVISTYDKFKSAGFNNLRLKESDNIHPNPLGHKLMAGILYEHLTSNYNLEDVSH